MFERFTLEARATVMLAQQQARDLGHDYIGTEHILLALLAQPDETVARQALVALGADEERVRAEVLAVVGPGEGKVSGHIPFTPRSKKVLELSLREALKVKSKHIGPEHILLGLVREGEGLASQILIKHDIDLPQIRYEVMTRLAGGVAPGRGRMYRVPDPRATSMTPGGARAADRAMHLAAGAPVASQHYLLGLLEDDESLAARALEALGVTRQAVEAKVAELGAEGTSDEPPDAAVARRTRIRVEGDNVLVSLEEPALAGKLRALLAGSTRHLPGVEAVFKATVPAVWNVARRMESAQPLQEWSPPGWSLSGAAAFAVMSRPEGPATRLWTAEDVDETAVRRWLATWLSSLAPAPNLADRYVYVYVSLDTAPTEEHGFTVAGLSMGARPAPPEWPAVPLADLVAAALADLTAA